MSLNHRRTEAAVASAVLKAISIEKSFLIACTSASSRRSKKRARGHNLGATL